MHDKSAIAFQEVLENKLGLILTIGEVKIIEDYFDLAMAIFKQKDIVFLWELESNVEVYGHTLAEAQSTGGSATILNRFTGKWKLAGT